MVQSHKDGDTSHAFSIAVKVYFAVKTLHGDMDITEPSSLLNSDKVNCK